MASEDPLQFEDAEEPRQSTPLMAPLNGEDKIVVRGKISQKEKLDTKKPNIADIAKARLSKWAARLFDPDRPKGLVEAPKVIPLNDEFLKAFGKREKESDKAMGISLEIDHDIGDESYDDENGGFARTPSRRGKRKVKIRNIKYTTSLSTLEAVCSNYGTIELAKLVMSKENTSQNSGLAYVTFGTADAAEACVDQLAKIDNRPITATLMGLSQSTRSTNMSASRYWQSDKKDISTKCFHCQGIGHMAADCKNKGAVKPCPLCAGIDHSDIRSCPFKAVCFNCGIPGHVSRECKAPRGLPARRICTVCYQSDSHHRSSCRPNGRTTGPPSVQQAVCLTCGKLGHYLCRDLKWFYGLRGVSCCNCGMPGHAGFQCKRPNADDCQRDDSLVQQELQRASTISHVENTLIEANKNKREAQNDGRGNRNNDRGRHNARKHDDKQRRIQSMPPNKRRRGPGSESNGQQIMNSGKHAGRRDSPGKRRGKTR